MKMVSSDNEKPTKKDDAMSRRRKRRGVNEEPDIAAPQAPVQDARAINKSKQTTYTPATRENEAVKLNEDGSSSLEDLFGLGSNQLRELMEQELPVPREDLITRKEVADANVDKNKVFKLPDLTEFMDVDGSKTTKSPESEQQRVDRKDKEAYYRVLQLNPFADADDTMFLEEYDIIPAIFGSGKLCGIPVPYLQTGHGILFIVASIAAIVYAPGNPLTEFPPEIRNFLKQGIVNIYAINVILAGRAFFVAKSKNLPAIFWMFKTFLLGGISFYEVNEAKDPAKINERTGPDPADRKSKRLPEKRGRE